MRAVGSTAPTEYEHAWMHADTAVIGGGWSGIHAAQSAAERGEEVVLIDDQPALGGQLRYRKRAGEIPGDLISRLEGVANVRILKHTYCFGLYEGNLLKFFNSILTQPQPNVWFICGRDRCAATGARETPSFPNNDLAGVMLSTGYNGCCICMASFQKARCGGHRSAVDEARIYGCRNEIVATVGQPYRRLAGVRGIRTQTGAFATQTCGPRVWMSASLLRPGKTQWVPTQAFLPNVPAHVSVVGEAAETCLPMPTCAVCSKRALRALLRVSGKDLCAESPRVRPDRDAETVHHDNNGAMPRPVLLSSIGVCEPDGTVGRHRVTTSRPRTQPDAGRC